MLSLLESDVSLPGLSLVCNGENEDIPWQSEIRQTVLTYLSDLPEI